MQGGFVAIILRVVFCGLWLLLSLPAATAAPAAGAPVRIAIDAEFSWPGSTSAQAIEQGVRIAIDEINGSGGVLAGRPLELITRDNGTVPARSIRNLEELAQVPDLVAVFCGRHSPVVIEAIDRIHELKLILLDPWAAADIITDHRHSPSYTFRLSLRDSHAMPALLDHGASRGIRAFGMMALNTTWGRSNLTAAEKHLQKNTGSRLVGVRWFNWQDQSLLDKYLDLKRLGAQAILLVANDREASLLMREMTTLPASERLPLLSHWGVSGGQMGQMAGSLVNEIDFVMVQTYSFVGDQRPRTRQVLAAASRLFGVTDPRAIASPVGLAHAYDLTHILARAIDAAGTTNRTAVRNALEQVRNHDGLIRRYARPFEAGRHDALTAADVILTRYEADGAIVPLPPRRKR